MFSLIRYAFFLQTICFIAEGVKKELFDTIHVCKRNDPDISECYRTNFNNALPMLRNGAPEMNIVSVDPILVNNIKLDFTQARNIKLEATLKNTMMYGLSKGQLIKCDGFITSNGFQAFLGLYFPKVIMKASYKAVGNFLVMVIDAADDFRGEFNEVNVNILFNSSLHMKNNVEYLVYKGVVSNFTVEKTIFRFNKLFGNNTEVNEEINHMMNENMDLLFEHVKPIFVKVIEWILDKIGNDFHGTFPYHILYPNY